MAKHQVNIDRINAALAEIAAFNRLPLAECEFFEKGRRLEIDPEVLENFRFIGLSNKCFVELRFWDENAPERQRIRILHMTRKADTPE